MTIQDAHYEFKKKFNKLDSSQNRNLLIPEIDWAIKEAVDVFIDLVARPRNNPQTGFEKNLKSIDDIRTLVITDQGSLLSVIDENTSLVTLPEDYRYFIKGKVTMENNTCGKKKAKFFLHEHNDDFEGSVFDSSSYLWGEVDGVMSSQGILIYNGDDFKNTEFLLSYIRKPKMAHNAANFKNGSYKLPSGEVLTGTSDIDLPEHTHREVIDLAVMIASGDLQTPDYQIKTSKISLNNLK